MCVTFFLFRYRLYSVTLFNLFVFLSVGQFLFLAFYLSCLSRVYCFDLQSNPCQFLNNCVSVISCFWLVCLSFVWEFYFELFIHRLFLKFSLCLVAISVPHFWQFICVYSVNIVWWCPLNTGFKQILLLEKFPDSVCAFLDNFA